MTKRRLGLLLGTVLGIILIVAGIVAWRISVALDASAINTAQTWARLAPFPATARELHVQTLGSMFTRQFKISFVAPKQDVASWIQMSPGPASAKQSADGSETVYEIAPGGGATFAEVRVDPSTGRVRIDTFWS